MAQGPYTAYRGTLRPLLAQKGPRGPTTYLQGQVGPKPQVGPPEPILAPNPTSPTNGQKDPRTQIGHFQPLAFGNHQRPPDQDQEGFP
ncbi:hypothetical protein O181_040211 [Austropuccinia psidii MF-1]|uniref:Uncharacterized protein n=1 Tax=Austropuccinia psidii MF-1 TaxID=1389203 RepID=A0A9Q3DHD2_9BASI|nr:hypothetical protein [Austropuccinia psidii MF-1]